MPIVWKNAMSVGHPLIDDEHKLLVCLINSCELALKVPNNDAMLLFVVRQLLEYTRNHFTAEENIMQARRYLKFDEHRKEHNRIIEEIKGVERLLSKNMTAGEKIDMNQLGLPEMMRHWIIDHVLNFDLMMKPLFDRASVKREHSDRQVSVGV